MLAVLLVGSTALPSRARAEDSRGKVPTEAAARVERTKLQAELNRINAEIDALKRGPRGIRNDYRLRDRMADAEAVARRLTDLDARLGPIGPAAVLPLSGNAAPSPPDVRVDPLDDRASREAKADILDDQAHRLNSDASRLEGRIAGLRTRNALKRRAGQLERDPFSPLEQAKGRVGVGSAVSAPKISLPRGGTSTTITGSNGASPSTPSAAPTVTTTLTPTTTPIQDPTGSQVGQLRGVLDPAALDAIRRLETPGSTPIDLEVMEHALATLRGRAAQLAATAARLRRPAPEGP